jgi:ferredoxin-NADP reductase/Na+-translocating ferredoxin:NAD+ oxidoreductase RnfD subunit
MKFINDRLDNLTMYQVLVYGMSVLFGWAIAGSAVGSLNFTIFSLVGSLFVLLFSAVPIHFLLAKIFKAPANLESTIITVLILLLILQPANSLISAFGLAVAGFVAIISKYILVWRKVHIFNPVVVAAVVVGLSFLVPVTWWIGSAFMFAPVLVVGLLIVHKIKRWDLFLTVILVSTVTVSFYGFSQGAALADVLRQHFLSWPIVFFASVMVTEPLSTPATRWQRIIYGTFIGTVSSVPISYGYVYTTPELTLLLANIYSFSTGLKGRLNLALLEKVEVAKDILEFRFTKPAGFNFTAGQYLEWTLVHDNPDQRGIKRYLTVSSSPTEDYVGMAVKMPAEPSSFKRKLRDLKVGEGIFVSQLIGDFTVPKVNFTERELVFIAGGIGVTPFRSIVKYVADSGFKASITLFYLVNEPGEIAYRDLFENVEGVRFVPVVTKMIGEWEGETGFLTEEMLRRYIENIGEATFYISGPPGMVRSYEQLLMNLGVGRLKIKKDFFPGYVS